MPLPPPNPNNLLPTSKQRLSLNCWRKENSDEGGCVCMRTRVSISSHHPLHSSLPLAALALCRCCWAELRFEGRVPHQSSRSIFKGSAGPCACGQRRECHPGAQLQSYFSAASQLGISWIWRGRPGAWWGLAAHTPHSFHGKEGIKDPFSGPLVELV